MISAPAKLNELVLSELRAGRPRLASSTER